MFRGYGMSEKDKHCGPRWGFARKAGPFGFGPPWMRGGGPGPRMRMFAPGDLRLLLLALIADQPAHGYDLIRTIEARFGGTYAPSPGTVYPTLTFLEEQGLIAASAEAGGKKSYAVTAEGRAFLAESATQVEALMARIDVMARGAGHAPMPEAVVQALGTLRHALMARSGKWDAGEEARVRQILEQAARDIAGGPPKA